jgi:hypothetical protein
MSNNNNNEAIKMREEETTEEYTIRMHELNEEEIKKRVENKIKNIEPYLVNDFVNKIIGFASDIDHNADTLKEVLELTVNCKGRRVKVEKWLDNYYNYVLLNINEEVSWRYLNDELGLPVDGEHFCELFQQEYTDIAIYGTINTDYYSWGMNLNNTLEEMRKFQKELPFSGFWDDIFENSENDCKRIE